MVTVPSTNPSFLISLTIQDDTITINLNITIHKWCSTCHYILTGLGSAASSLTSLLQVWLSISLSHYYSAPKRIDIPPTRTQIKLQSKTYGKKMNS